MISEVILEGLKCASSDQKHFVIEPISLINCGHSVCKKCISKNDLKEIKCKTCGLVSEQDLNKSQDSKGIHNLLKMCTQDRFKISEGNYKQKGILN